MGSYFSQEEEEIISPDEIECTTPQLPTTSYSKLFSFVNDPRSPSNVSRTPIVVQEPFVDPRSPANDLVDRTPLFDGASTPIVRFKLDNEGFEASPMMNPHNRDNDDDVDDGENTRSLDNEAYIHSPIVNKIRSDGIEDLQEDYDYEIIGENPESFAKTNCSDGNRENKQSKNQLKKRFNATQKSILKTVLFKPYEELDDKQVNVPNVTPKKKPLGLRKDTTVNKCGDILDNSEALTHPSKMSNDGVNKFSTQQDSFLQKENAMIVG